MNGLRFSIGGFDPVLIALAVDSRFSCEVLQKSVSALRSACEPCVEHDQRQASKLSHPVQRQGS